MGAKPELTRVSGGPVAVGHSDTATNGIRVEVRSTYVPERSSPEVGAYFFVYRIRISNEGTFAAKLTDRHWIITDAFGMVEEVKDPGVVGKQPRLEPGETFEYTSACPLGTLTGTMHGTYRMERDDGETFDADIGEFGLAVPNVMN